MVLVAGSGYAARRVKESAGLGVVEGQGGIDHSHGRALGIGEYPRSRERHVLGIVLRLEGGSAPGIEVVEDGSQLLAFGLHLDGNPAGGLLDQIPVAGGGGFGLIRAEDSNRLMEPGTSSGLAERADGTPARPGYWRRRCLATRG